MACVELRRKAVEIVHLAAIVPPELPGVASPDAACAARLRAPSRGAHRGSTMVTRTKMEALVAKLRRALDERMDAEAAEKLFREVVAEAQRLGFTSAYVHFVLAGVLDRSGKLEMAFDELKKAVRADPLALPVRHAFLDVAARLRAALVDPARAADDADVPRLYTLLVEAGEADLDTHLAMVRHALATAQLERARALAEAVTTLFPAAREAHEALARVARAQGDLARATRAEAEAAVLGGVQMPLFGVIGKANA
jgi:tetratricopeptide (TPR) repeat protein